MRNFPLLIFFTLFFCALSYSQRYQIKRIDLNSKFDHFSFIINNEKVYFTSNVVTPKGYARKDIYNDNMYTVYEAKMAGDGEIIEEKPVLKNYLKYHNMSTSTFTKDGRFMYFSSNSRKKSDKLKSGANPYNLLLIRAEYKDSIGWTNFKTLPFCETDYGYTHPALSPDNRTLYFVSNRSGTKGKSDIYKVSVSEDQMSYGPVTRLNKAVNSSKSELFPFVSNDNVLYFASNRSKGKGGLDIYSYYLNTTDKNIKAKHLPEPINSKFDDFSFYINKDNEGYFSSRREGGKGGDDVFYFSR